MGKRASSKLNIPLWCANLLNWYILYSNDISQTETMFNHFECIPLPAIKSRGLHLSKLNHRTCTYQRYCDLKRERELEVMVTLVRCNFTWNAPQLQTSLRIRWTDIDKLILDYLINDSPFFVRSHSLFIDI